MGDPRTDDAASETADCDITPLIGILGSGSGPSDIAREKGQMIDEAFGEENADFAVYR